VSGTTVHLAPVVLPVVGPPIREGAVAVEGGDIVAVGPRSSLAPTLRSGEVIEWDGVMVPGLVNAHAHLQFTSFAAVGAARHRDYVAWSARFVAEYEARATGEDWAATARGGVAAALSNGVTCFADIVTDLPALGALAAEGVAGVAYLEVLGVDDEQWREGVEEWLEDGLSADSGSPDVRIGVSPHAPYSVDRPVLVALGGVARRRGCRLHVHLAESDTEDAYYRWGSGALAERVRARRRGRPFEVLAKGGVGMGAAAYARSCGLLGPDTHVAHGVYLGEEGRAVLRATGSAVALCPRSNEIVGIDPPPVAAYLSEGNHLAVGTDSLGSNSSLDLMADVALLRELAQDGGYRRGDLDRRLLEAATIDGARALGLSGRVGSLEAGKRADLAVFDVDPDDAVRALVTGGAGRCVGVVAGGVVRS
jgi:aminodeoxyfutalosine deaminase